MGTGQNREIITIPTEYMESWRLHPLPPEGQLVKWTKIVLVDTVAAKPHCTLSTFQRLSCLPAREGRGTEGLPKSCYRCSQNNTGTSLAPKQAGSTLRSDPELNQTDPHHTEVGPDQVRGADLPGRLQNTLHLNLLDPAVHAPPCRHRRNP